MKDKICLVLIGYGRKTDLSTGNIFDLDTTYQNIIIPAAAQAGYLCIRVQQSEMTVPLLMKANMVIVDVSTGDLDVLYKLAIRNALWPFSTIVIKEKGIGRMPFEMDHIPMFTYLPVGSELNKEILNRSVNGLYGLIRKTTLKQLADDSFKEPLPNETDQWSDKTYQHYLEESIKKEKIISAATHKALHCIQEGNFELASYWWEQAKQEAPQESYFLQQLALAKYKSGEADLLSSALKTLDPLYPSNDPETLGIAGAIYKTRYLTSNDPNDLFLALEHYRKAYKAGHTYYSGENLALCLDLKATLEQDENEKSNCIAEARWIRKKLAENLEQQLRSKDFEHKLDKTWMYATLAHCYFLLNNDQSTYFENKFLASSLPWQQESYQRNKQLAGRF